MNKYYPPDWTPAHGSLDRYHGQHPLRERARKLSQGILIIRFEMPYNIWCGGCGNHIGMGVRYNAEKKKVGNYYTTPIYRFRMKCHLCDNHFEIETDPKNCDYVIVSGARRKEERWEPSATETVELTDREDAKKMATDPMFKLEHGVKDEQKSKAVQPTLGQLQEVQSVWKDDYAANQLLRKKFREQKHELKAQKVKDNALKEKGSLDVALVPERLEDIELAKKIQYHGEGFDGHRRKRRFEVNSRPMFNSEGKQDDRRDKTMQLLGKRKMMQFSSFASPSKSDNDLVKLGIKVLRNRSLNSESSDKGLNEYLTNEDRSVEDPATKGFTNKDPREKESASNEYNARTDRDVNETSTSVLDKPTHRTPNRNITSATDSSFPAGPGVTSKCQTCEENDNTTSFSNDENGLANEVRDDVATKQGNALSKDSLTSPELNNHKTMEKNGCSETKTDDSIVRNPLLGSLVCCDYADSSDASDDTP